MCSIKNNTGDKKPRSNHLLWLCISLAWIGLATYIWNNPPKRLADRGHDTYVAWVKFEHRPDITFEEWTCLRDAGVIKLDSP